MLGKLTVLGLHVVPLSMYKKVAGQMERKENRMEGW